MNTDTALGKGLKTLIWLMVSNAVVAGVTYVTGHQELFNPYWVSLANVVLVLVKNFADPKVENW